MTIEPVHLQIAGIVFLVLVGIGFVLWIVRAVMGWQPGRHIYMLPDRDDEDDDRDGDGLEGR